MATLSTPRSQHYRPHYRVFHYPTPPDYSCNSAPSVSFRFDPTSISLHIGGFAASLAYVLSDAPYPDSLILTGVALVAIQLGLITEFVQLQLSHRYFNDPDLAMNTADAVITVFFSRRLYRQRTPRPIDQSLPEDLDP